MNNKKIKRLIEFKFYEGALIKEDNSIKNLLWASNVDIEIPSTEKRYAAKGKALLKLLKREGQWISIDQYDKNSIKLSLLLKESSWAHSTDQFFNCVDDILEFINPRLDKIDIRECVITLSGEINWHKRKAL